MDEDKDISIDQSKLCWFIDLDWYQKNNRTFFSIAYGCLCSKCKEQLKREVPAADLLSTIKDCCSKAPDFISDKLPILESIFRLFLANGDHPLDLEELSTQLNEWRGGDSHRTPAEILSRLLESDQYYGLRQISEAPQPSV